jgi:hypothetical protein
VYIGASGGGHFQIQASVGLLLFVALAAFATQVKISGALNGYERHGTVMDA